MPASDIFTTVRHNTTRTVVFAKTRVRSVVRKRTYRFISQTEMEGSPSFKGKLTLAPTEEIEIKGPQFIGDYDYHLESPPSVRLKCPPSIAYEYEDVHVLGGSSLILAGDLAVHPDLAAPATDMFSIEISGEASVDQDARTITLVNHGPTLTVPSGISLLGECNGNYAHWLIETLPKLVMIDQVADYRDLPLIVDGWIHPVFFDTLRLLNTTCRKIVRVQRWQKVAVKKLIQVSPPSYTAPESRAFHLNGTLPISSPDAYQMSARQFSAMRDKAIRNARKFALGAGAKAPANIIRVKAEPGNRISMLIHDPKQILDPDVRTVLGERIYLRRTAKSSGNPRSMLEAHRVESLLADYGFVAVDPATVSFAEQVLLLGNAKCVAAPLGAALANAIFAPPGLKIIGLSPYYRGADYYYFSNMMGAAGHDLAYVLGPQVEKQGTHWLHHDYVVDLSALAAAVEEFCGPASPTEDRQRKFVIGQ